MTIRTYESLPTAAARIGVSVKTIRRRSPMAFFRSSGPAAASTWTRRTSTPCSVASRSARRPNPAQGPVPPDARRKRVPRPSKAHEEPAGIRAIEDETHFR